MDYNSSTDLDPGVGIALIIGYFIFIVILYVVFSFIMGRIFKKAGEDAWKAWVPVYNSWVFLELGGQKGYWSLLAFVPVVNIASAIFMAIAAYHIGLNLQKEGWFVVLYILLSPVWFIWLAFDSSTWKGGNLAAAPAGTPAYQPPAPMQQPQAPQAMTPQSPQPEQNNTPPTPPIAS